MAVLVSNTEYNWLPNKWVYKRFAEDVLSLNYSQEYEKLIDDVIFSIEAYIFTLNYEKSTISELFLLLEVTIKVLALNEMKNVAEEDKQYQAMYLQELNFLKNKLFNQIKDNLLV